MKKFLIWYGYILLVVSVIAFSLMVLTQSGGSGLLLIGFVGGWFANKHFTIKKKKKKKKTKRKKKV